MARLTTKADLLSNVATTGGKQTIDMGGRFLLVACGTFDGATIKVQIEGPDGSTMIDLPDAALTAAGAKLVYLPDNAVVRGAVSGGTAPAGLHASLRRCPE